MSRLRVAITGAGGRVGSALAARLAAHPEFEVVAIVRNAFAASLLLATGAKVRVGSVTDPAASRVALAGCDAVVNCALAQGWPPTARRQNEAIVRNIAAAPGVARVVHFSTVAVYGMCIDPRVSTFARPRPDSTYGLDKLRLEGLATRLFGARGMRHYIVRLGHVYGPSQWVSRDILERVRDPAFALPFGGENPSNAVSIAAVAAAVRGLLSGDEPSGIRNLFDAPQSSWRTLYDLHTRLLGLPPVGSLPQIESLAARHEHYAAARRPWRSVARGALSALGSMNLVALAQMEAFRYLVHRPLLLLPGALGAAAHRAYLARKARSALRRGASMRALPPGLMYAPGVPGPCFPTLDSREAARGLQDELQAWLHGLWSYRWDPAAYGLAADDAGARPIAATARR